MAKDRLLDVVSESSDYKRYEDDIKKALSRALNFLDKTGKVEVSLVGKSRMRDLNKEYRDKDEPTNVLSFTDPDDFPDPESPEYLGEVYLCPEIIEERGDDIIHLAIHGFLHLVGYTHKEKSDTIDMERKEEEILQLLSD